MSYILSVIIPTKNRYQYLKECLETLNSINSQDIEIVVQDNTINNTEIKSFIYNLNNSNIKYFHDTSKLSQSENSDLAVRNSTGKYVCYIGDDDTITSQMLDIVRWLDRNDIDSCVFPVATYYWPDVVFKFFKYPTLSFQDKKFEIKYISARDELEKCLRKGAISLLKMPKVYHGIVRRSILDEIQIKTNSYFPGPSPDMANATALSLLVKKHLKIEVPLMVSGFSYKSAGGMGARGKHKAKLEEVDQIPKDTVERWEIKLPKIWLAATIWSESCAKALKAMGEETLLDMMDWTSVYASVIVNNPDCIDEVRPLLNSQSVRLRTYIKVVKYFILKSLNFAINFIKTKLKFNTNITFHSVSSLSEAFKITNEHNDKLMKQFTEGDYLTHI
jgi:glycosyltransferase involved in cell wall biosynthesis